MPPPLFRPKDSFRFSADWITLPEADKQPNVYFRAFRSFRLDQVPEQALLRIAADSFYLLYLNGRQVSTGPVRGTWTVNYFDTLDVTEYLHPGENRIGVLVHSPITEPFIVAPVEAALLLEIPGIISSGPDWLVQRAPEWKRDVPLFSLQTGYMDYCDLRQEPEGWLTGKLDASWQPARCVSPTSPLRSKHLLPRDVPALREFVLSPIHILEPHEVAPLPENEEEKLATQLNNDILTPLPAGRISGLSLLTSLEADGICEIAPDPSSRRGVSFILDFGRSLVGNLSVRLSAPAGTIVDVTYSEEIWRAKGDRLRAQYACSPNYNFADRYLLKEGENLIGTQVTQRGFRMVQLTIRNFAEPVRILQARACGGEYPYIRRGVFHCSDPLLDRIWNMCLDTLQACTTDVFLDCPWRERAFWVNDLIVENRTSLAAFGASPVHRRAFALAFSQQREDGYLPGVCPAPAGTPKDNIVLFPTNLLIVIMLHDYLMASGDRETVACYLPNVERILDAFEALADEKGILTVPEGIWNFYDWSFELNDYSFSPARESMINFLYVTALRTYRDLCRTCGRPCDTETLERRALRTATAVQEEFVSPQTGLLEDNVRHQDKPAKLSSQLAHAFALLSGMVREENRTRFLGALTDPTLLQPELYLHLFVFDAMMLAGEEALANGLARIRRYWGKCVDTGYPTLYEAAIHQFGRDAFFEAGSLCHGFGTSPIRFFHNVILGVRPLSPGYQEFAVEPRLFDLDFASGRIPTPAGEIALDCLRTPEGIQVKMEVPLGLTALCQDKRYAPGHHTFTL